MLTIVMSKRFVQTLFCKTIAASVAFTFLYSQLLYAADVRQMILDAKTFFAEEDQKQAAGGLSTTQLQSQETQQQAAIDQQNTLQDLQKLNFSLTTQNGDLLTYVGNALKEVKRPDGTALGNIQLNEDGSIKDADLRLPDGSIQILRDGQVLGYELPDGTQVVYENGQVQKTVSPQGVETTYSYIRNEEGVLTEIILENANARVFYTPEGKIKQSLNKIDGSTTDFDPMGIIQKITYLDQSVLLFQQIPYGNDTKVIFHSFRDVEGKISYEAPQNTLSFQYAVYRPDGSPKEILGVEGNTFTFNEEGLLIQILDSYHNPTQVSLEASALSNVIGVTLRQGNLSSVYDAEGHLSQITINGLTLHYQGGVIDSIETADGTRLTHLVFGADGQILNAEAALPDGRIRVYENGHLVRTKEQDLTQLFYQDDQITKLITPEALAYNFNYTPDKIEATLDFSLGSQPSALSPIKMEYDQNFNLLRVIRQNAEILNYLEDDLIRIDYPNDAPQVFNYVKDEAGKILSYSIVQGNVETFYDANNQVIRSVISPTDNNSHTLEVIYRYGKIREIYKDSVLTFQYSYTFDQDGSEITHIEDLEEKTAKIYKDGNLLSSFSTETSVLSTYSYLEGRVSEVKVTRLGRALHTYVYSYEGELTIVTDEVGVIRTYSADKKLIFLEKENARYSYQYHQNPDGEEIIEETLIERKLDDGSVVTYENGVISRIDRPDGSFITEVVLDSARNIQSGKVTLPSGVQKVFSQNTLLEEIATDGTHFYFEDNKISKVTTSDGKELIYSYEKDANGNVTSVWVQVGTTHLQYNLEGTLLRLKLDEVLTKEEVRQATQHTYEGGGVGPYSIDGDFNTAQSSTASQSFDLTQGNVSVRIYSTHSFPTPQTVTGLNYRVYTYGGGWGDYSYYNSGSGSYSIEYQQGTSVWVPFVGAQGGMGDTGKVAKTLNVSGVTAIRVVASAYGSGSDHGGCNAGAYIYEIQATLTDQAHLNFQMTKDAQDQLTGYSFQGDNGTLRFNAEGNLSSVNPNPLNAAGINDRLQSSAQSLNGMMNSLVSLPFMERLNFTKDLGNGVVTEYRMGELFKVYKDGALAETYSRKVVDGAERLVVTDQNLIREYDLGGELLGIRLLGVSDVVEGSKAFIDADAVKNSVMVYGDTKITALDTPPVGLGCAAFGGSGDYLSFADHVDWTPSADFTLDFRVNFDSFNNSQAIAGHYQDGSNYWTLEWSGNALKFYQVEAGVKTIDIQNSWTPFPNTWYHIALVRSGNGFTMYVNGVPIGSAKTDTSPLRNFNGEFWIARNPASPSNYFGGGLDELRFSHTARWSANFIPQAQPYAPDSQTKLLLHFDGIDSAYYGFQKEFDSQGKLTGYLLRGDGGNLRLDAQGNFVSLNPVFILRHEENASAVTYLPSPTSAMDPKFFGDGRDGDVKISSNTTLTQDMYYNSLTIGPGVTLNPNGYKIFVKGALVNNGIISAKGYDGGNGGNAWGEVLTDDSWGKSKYWWDAEEGDTVWNPGAAGSAGLAAYTLARTLGAGTSGVAGNRGHAWEGGNFNGSAGTSVNPTISGAAGAGGGGGGRQDNQDSSGGGNAGTATQTNILLNSNDSFLNYNFSALKGGASGGSGGGGGARDPSRGNGGGGGGSGAGGGVIMISAQSIDNQNGIITAAGGNGGNGGNGAGSRAGGGGGGGGGGAGSIYLIYNSIADGAVLATGGKGGQKGLASGGTNGQGGTDGSSGMVFRFTAKPIIFPAINLLYDVGAIDVVNPGVADWFAIAKESVLGAQEVVAQEYSSKGVLETQTKADQTVTLFDDNNRPSKVLDDEGTVLIEYSYDAEGHPSRVYLKNARDTLPGEVLKVKQAIEENRVDTLLNLAKQKNLVYQQIQSAYAEPKQQLKSQLQSLQDQFNNVSSIKVSGKAAKNQKGDVLNQIGGAMDQVRAALTDLLREEANHYAALDSTIKIESDRIEYDSQKAFQELAIQEANLKREILRQEVSPIVYDAHRRILGRDPSSAEYEFWIQKIDYDNPGFVTLEREEEQWKGASVRLDGMGGYLSLPYTPDWDFRTGDFTVDFWFKPNVFDNGKRYDLFRRSGDFAIRRGSDNLFKVIVEGSIKNFGAWTPALGVWHHIAVVRQTGSLCVFINGIKLSSAVLASSDIQGYSGVEIGRGGASLNGWLEEFRVSKGVARWAANFAPPQNRLISDSYTMLLLQSSFQNGSFVLKDNSVFNRTVKLYSSAKLDPNQYRTQEKVIVKVPYAAELSFALRSHIEALPELQERRAYVQAVKDRVAQKINQYLSLSQEEKLSFASALGLSMDDLIGLSESDAQKILNWLGSRSLHFGQSAFLSLESLLDQKGIPYAREDLAEKCILIDILSGVITPLDEGDLVISVFALNKVAKLYGVDLLGANLSYEDLIAIFQSNPNARVIAHINGNHYVVITGITQDTITYIDSAIGKDKQNESLTVTKAGFLKVWKGSVSLEQSQVPTVSNYQQKLLSASQAQIVRGAGWNPLAFFLGIGSLLLLFTPLAPIAIGYRVYNFAKNVEAGNWLAVGIDIASLGLQFIDFGTILSNFFTGFAQALGPIGQFFSTAYQAVTGFFNSAISFLPGIGPALQGGAAAQGVDLGAQIVNFAISTGINMGISRGLESIGVNPEIAGFVGDLTAGAVIAGMKGDTILESGRVITQAQHIQSSLQQVVTLQQIGSLGLELGLDSGLTNIIGLSLSAMQGQQILNPGTTLEIAFNNIKPQLFSSLAQWGVEKIGTSLGLDPRVSSLIGAPISAVVGGVGFDAGKTWGENAINAINQGILRGGVSLGIEYLTQEADLDPLLGSLTSRAITGAIAGLFQVPQPNPYQDPLNPNDDYITPRNIFEGIWESFTSSALNVARLGVSGTDSWSQAQYLQRVLNFSDIIQTKGLAQAIEDSAAQILHEDAISSILRSFSTVGAYIQDAIDKNKFKRIEVNGKFFRELEINAANSIRTTDDYKDLARIQRGEEILEGSFGKVDDVFGEIKGSYQNTLGDEFNSYEQFQRIENGQQTYAEIKNSSGATILVITPKEQGSYSLFNSVGEYVDSVISLPSGFSFPLNKITFDKSGIIGFDQPSPTEGINIRTTIDKDGRISQSLTGDLTKLSTLQEIATGMDSTGRTLGFGERFLKGLNLFGEYSFGFTRNVGVDIGAGLTAEVLKKLNITPETFQQAVADFKAKGAEFKETINNYLAQKKAEGSAFEVLDVVQSFKLRAGLGQATLVEISNNLSKTNMGADVFAGAKASLIANGEFSDKIEVGGQVKFNYESAHASLGAFGQKNYFSDDAWTVNTQTSFGISNVNIDSTGTVSLKFKFHRSLLGVEGSLDLNKASDIVAEKVDEAYSKVLALLG